ncbi:fibronectin type III domain-containing protein [Clostridium tarantellae]|uniref:Alpha-galactosidase n=1 Tax=Clostridium tarantellae TaxID=39493 RepID=A0A6I1MNI8_9CLOT|nr:fibronectin type III domain-containing protein [Clostridium tarantellae]MPQ44975.1 hypothetical protein [Clostridium tarantellae]
MKNNKLKIMALISSLMITSSLVTPIKSVIANEKLKKVSETEKKNLAPVPPMGWNSWNTFGGNINETVIKETVDAMVNKGLADAGYEYVVLDDGYIENSRDSEGKLVPHRTKFPNGFKPLSDYIHENGLKFGMYNSAGTGTCMNLPGSFGHEKSDADQFAEWEIDFFKYDFCNNPISEPEPDKRPDPNMQNMYSADIGTIRVYKGDFTNNYEPNNHTLIGKAEINSNGYLGYIGKNEGESELTVNVPENGVYKVDIKYIAADKGRQVKIDVNGQEGDFHYMRPTKSWNVSDARTLTIELNLNAGENTLKFSNPYNNKQEANLDGAIRSYRKMANSLNSTGRDILFSVCEWGNREPWLWADEMGHMWRTTGDITFNHGKATWGEVVDIYDKNVDLAKYAGPNGWNDPDMLVVGLQGLNYEENKSHFTLWSAMAAPLMIGNDIRNMSDEVADILTNKDVIALNQDPLGVQAYKIKDEGDFEVLAKPLENGDVGIVLFNRSNSAADISVTIDEIAEGVELVNEDDFLSAKNYNTKELWDKTEGVITTEIKGNEIPAHGVKVFRVSPVKDTETPNEKPGKVENLSVVETTSNTIKLSWTEPSIGGEVSKYIIYKDGVKLDEVPANLNEYEVTNLEANTLYGFKIVAVGIDGQISRPIAKNVRTTK